MCKYKSYNIIILVKKCALLGNFKWNCTKLEIIMNVLVCDNELCIFIYFRTEKSWKKCEVF